MKKDVSPQESKETPSSPAHQPACKVIPTRELFGERTEVILRHGEDRYRLLITKNGKLLLNK